MTERAYAYTGGRMPGLSFASNAWTPASLPSLIAWYDASNAGSLTGGAALSQWNDLSGNGNHLTQSSGAAKPSSGTRTLNGLNVVDFISSDWMSVTFSALTQPVSILLVLDLDSTTDQNVYGSNDAASDHELFINGGPWALYAGSIVNSSQTATTGAKQYITVMNGASSLVYVSGVASSAMSSPGTQTMHGLTLGADPNRLGALDGGVGEFAIMNASISSGDRALWGSYTNPKWGVA